LDKALTPARAFYAWCSDLPDEVLDAYPPAVQVALRRLFNRLGNPVSFDDRALLIVLVEDLLRLLQAPPCPPPWAKSFDLTAKHHRLLGCLWGDGRPRGPVPTSRVLKAVYGRSPCVAAAFKAKVRALKGVAKRAQRCLDGDCVPLCIYINNTHSELKGARTK
jgi:hypothetical protein